MVDAPPPTRASGGVRREGLHWGPRRALGLAGDAGNRSGGPAQGPRVRTPRPSSCDRLFNPPPVRRVPSPRRSAARRPDAENGRLLRGRDATPQRGLKGRTGHRGVRRPRWGVHSPLTRRLQVPSPADSPGHGRGPPVDDPVATGARLCVTLSGLRRPCRSGMGREGDTALDGTL